MTNYKELNDYELVSLAQERNEDAINILHKKYYPLIEKKCRKIYNFLKSKGIDIEDIIQECYIGFEESINEYNQNDDVTFYTFTNICIDREIASIIKRINRNKNKLFNESISLDNDNEVNLVDILKDNTYNPEEELITNEKYTKLYNKITDKLTNFEEYVLILRINLVMP